MSCTNVIIAGTQFIQTINSGIGATCNFIGGGISLIVGKTGLYNTNFWKGNGTTWKGISGIWASLAPFLKEIGIFLRSGYGTGLIYGVLSLLAFRFMISSIYNKSLLGTLGSLVAFVALGMLAYVAFTYGTALVVMS